MHFWNLLRKTVWLLTVALVVCAGRAPAQTVPRTVLAGHVPSVVSHLQPLGRLDPSTRLTLCLDLALHHQPELTNLLDQLYDPASPRYHHYLTPDQFNAQFGPTAAEYQSVLDWAARNAFTITGRPSNRRLLEVSAPVPVIERALQVTLRTYAHPAEARDFYAPDREPSLDAALPVSYVGGLDNFARPHPKNLHHLPLQLAQASPHAGSGPNGTLAGFDYRAAYAPGVALTGAGQQVGLVEFDGYYSNDIVSYRSQTGVSNVPLQTILLDGFNGVPSRGASSGNGEVALDIEMSMAMAPGLSKIVVYESDTNGFPSNLLLAMAGNPAIKQFSCSWDFGPITSAQRTAMDGFFQEFEADGQSFFDASGDTGATNSVTEPPDDDPYVTQVGGTTLATTGPGGGWLSELVWNAGDGPGYAGTSGGVSAIYPRPAWQAGVNMTTNHGSTTFRNYPDVAMVADNIFLVADNGQNEASGGTSCAAPLWAGFTALANQQAAAIGSNSVGFINPALYHIGTNASYTACFNDITVGNNTNFNATQYLAAPGYDLCTGWGSPAGASLIIALTQPDGLQILPGANTVAGGPAGGPFTRTNLTLVLTNTGRSAFSWSLGATSQWLNVSSRSGTLTPGGGANAVTVTLNPAANLLTAGVYPANLWFTNLSSGLVQLRQFTLQVSQNLVQDGGFEAGDFAYWNLAGNASVYTNDFVDNGAVTGYSAYAGNNFAALGEIGALAALSQPLTTRPGQIYQLSLWLENPTPKSTPNQFEVQWNTNATSTNIIFNQTNLGTFGWSNLVFTVKAFTNVTTLQFAALNDVGFFALDSVSVLPVPAPAVRAVKSGKTTFQVSWTALPGLSYQMQYLTNLLTTNWVNLGGTVIAGSNSITLTETNAPNPARYYRVELLP